MEMENGDNKSSAAGAQPSNHKKVQEKQNPENPAAEEAANAKKAIRSRKMISSTANTPEWLRDMFEIPSNALCVHVQHKDNCLPHFQARFNDNFCHDGKNLF